MAVLNLRDVPDELARELRVEAAQADMGVRQYCVAVLSSRKKIADISVGGGTTEGGGDPCLPRGGKAQAEMDIPEIADWSGGERGKFYRGEKVVLKARSAGLSTLAAELNARAEEIIPAGDELNEAQIEALKQPGWIAGPTVNWEWEPIGRLPDGVPCGHAGCLSHLSHPCEGCGRIGGRRPIYNMEDNASAGRGKVRHYICPKGHGTFTGFEDKCPLCESEKYKSKSEEEQDGIKGSGEAGQDKRIVGGDSQSVAEGDHGAQEPAVGVGKPGVNMQALRDICEGKGIRPAPLSAEPVEVDLCGFKSYNETDGEWYVCTKENHGVKVNHGDWLKV